MARCLLGTANGLVKEVFLLPLVGSGAAAGLETGHDGQLVAAGSHDSDADASALISLGDASAAAGVDVHGQAGRTKFLREKQAHEAALDQQERAQKIAWGAMEAGTAVVDMLLLSGSGSGRPGTGTGESTAVVFAATTHEPHKKISDDGSGESSFGAVDEDEAEAAVYTAIECYSPVLSGGGSSIQRGGFSWAEGGASCVGRTAATSPGDGADRATIHVPGRIISLSPVSLKAASGHTETVVLSCTVSGDLRLHRVLEDGEGDGQDPLLPGESIRRISQDILGNLGSGVSVMRVGEVVPLADPATTSIDVLVGGEEHDLEVWNVVLQVDAGSSGLTVSLSRAPTRTFRAKNLPDDKYAMRPKVWITDFCILSHKARDTNAKSIAPVSKYAREQTVVHRSNDYRVACVTKYGQFRVFDTSVRRRCTLNVEGISTHPLQAIAVANYKGWYRDSKDEALRALCKIPVFLAVADSVGALFQIDPDTGAVVAKYKNSAAGAVRRNGLTFTTGFVKSKVGNRHSDEFTVEAAPLLISAGLDRTLRTHHALTRKLLHRIFVKQQINCVMPLPTEVPNLQASSGSKPPEAARKKQAQLEGGSDEDSESWGMDEEDILAGVRSAAPDKLESSKSRQRRGKAAPDSEDEVDERAENLEAASALAVVEAQMNSTRQSRGKNLSASRSENVRRVQNKRSKREREIREYKDLNAGKGSAKGTKRSRR